MTKTDEVHVYNFEETLNAFREIVETAHPEGPDFVYEPPDGMDGYCVYYRTAEEGPVADCIVGRLMEKLGITAFREICVEGSNAGYWNGESINNVYFIPLMTENFTQLTRDFILGVQRRQDNSMKWGKALQEAYRQIPTDHTEWVSWDGQFKGFTSGDLGWAPITETETE